MASIDTKNGSAVGSSADSAKLTASGAFHRRKSMHSTFDEFTYDVPLVDPPRATNHFPFKLAMRILGGEVRGTTDQIRSFAEWTHVGDRAADALVSYMKRPDVASAEVRRMFNLALEEGISAVRQPPEELADFFGEAESVPYWVDFKRIDQGSRFMRSLGYDAALLAIVGLSIGYLSEQANLVMIRSGELEKRAAPRVIETNSWIYEVIQPGALLLHGPGYQSAVRLRLTHAFVRSGVGKREDWDPAYMPMHQSVYVTAILLFSLLAVMLAMTLGHIPTKKERDSVFHLWRYIAYLMGVDTALIPADIKDMFRLMRASFHENVHLEEARMVDGLKLGKALLGAYGPIFGLAGGSVRERITLSLAERVTSTITFVLLGRETAGAIGYRRPSYWLMPALGAYAGFNFTRSALSRLIPGMRARYEAKQSSRITNFLENATARLDVNKSFVRE